MQAAGFKVMLLVDTLGGQQKVAADSSDPWKTLTERAAELEGHIWDNPDPSPPLL